MTKISNQYSLTNILTADLANSRLGINNVSPAYSLDLTGTARTSGATYLATGGSNVGIGTTSPAGISTYTTLDIRGATGGGIKMGVSASSTPFNLQQAGTDAYLNNVANGAMLLYTNDTERMRITSAGQVIIGDTSIAYTNAQGYTLGIKSASTSQTFLSIVRSGQTLGSQGMNIGLDTGAAYFFVNDNIATVFRNNAAETMRITSGGAVLIGTTTDIATGWKLQVNSLIATLGTDAALVYQNRSDSTRYTFYATGGVSYFFNGGNIAQINMSNGAYTALSDINKKKDFEQSNIGLNEVLQLKPTLYRMKTDDESSRKELGFIAQEVNELIPQAYVETGEGDDKFIGLTEMPIIAALTKAIQELSAKVSLLENK